MTGYVVVTIADHVVHAYGDENGDPFPTAAQAQARARTMLRRDREFYPDQDAVAFHVRKIIGGAP